MVVGLGFDDGGFFPAGTAVAAIVFLLALLAGVLAAGQPGEGMGVGLLTTAVLLALFAAWTVLSGRWSGAETRAIFEFDRVVLYGSTLVLFGSARGSDARVGALLKGALAGYFVLCLAALISRLTPDLWSIGVEQRLARLQYPVTYANTLGFIAATAMIWSFALAVAERASWRIRAAGAAGVPLFAVTLLLSYSRGAIAAAGIGVVVFVLVRRSWTVLAGVLATVPTTAAALAVAYNADVLATADFSSAQALRQGHRVAFVVALCAILAAVVRLLCGRFEPRLERLHVGWASPRRVGAAVATAAVAVVLLLLSTGILASLGRHYDQFVRPGAIPTSNVRQRLGDVNNNGRLQAWHVALRDFSSSPLQGTGAGTFSESWIQRRPEALSFNQTHSLYLQMLGELGLVGFGLLMAALSLIFIAWKRGVERNRVLYGALLAAGVAWAVDAAVDWQWQMPVATLWIFALGGASLARRDPAASGSRPMRWVTRGAVSAAVLVSAIAPALAARSESHLSASVAAFKHHDCTHAVQAADAARAWLPTRPQPFEILGYCALLARDAEAAVQFERTAITRDPHDWSLHYALALVQAASGIDPRQSVRAALRLNPLEPQLLDAVGRLRGSAPQQWQRAASQLSFTIPFTH
ncbi:MAG: O-antigen ligase family protein [Solirubrobacteraceae bacterium]